jgi:predicted GIY-YIG superfamily endonuclease
MSLGSEVGGIDGLSGVTTFLREGNEFTSTTLFDSFVTTVFCEEAENLPKVKVENLHLTDTLKTAKDTIKGQSGIYAFQCLETGAYYIGSSVDLYDRFYAHLMDQSSNLHLQRAILKYGLASFVFFVVELCAKDQLMVREQHWLDWLFTQHAELRYNFLPTAGSSLGSTHTEEAKGKMRGPRPPFSPSPLGGAELR